MDSKNKLVRAISAEELQAFLDELSRTKGVDGPMIQELAQQRFGVSMGHESANNFRKEVFHKYLARLSSRKQRVAMITANRDISAGTTLADAASEELSQLVFDFLTEVEDDNGKPLDLTSPADMKKAAQLSNIIARMRSGDRAMIDQLTDRVKELEAEKKAAAKALDAAADKGASAQLIQSVRDALNFRPPQDAVKPSSTAEGAA